jgi:hypothetical protein
MSLFPIISPAGAQFQVDAATFDGSVYGDYSSTPTGLADGKKITASFWYKKDSDDTVEPIYYGTGNGDLQIVFQDTNKFNIRGFTSGFSKILEVHSTGTQVVADGWVHWYVAVDLSTTTVDVYRNGVDDSPDEDTVTDSTMDLAEPGAHIFANHTAGTIGSGDLAEFWMHTNYYAAATYASSFVSGGKPVDLGADGSTPTGVQPLFYYHLDDGEAAANFFTNAGTAGDPTETSGTLSTASTSPSD